MILYLCLWGGGGMLGEVAESTQLNSSGSGPNRKKNCLEQASNIGKEHERQGIVKPRHTMRCPKYDLPSNE